MSPCQASRLAGIRLLREHLLHQCLLLTASQMKWQDLELVPAATHARSQKHSKKPAALLCARWAWLATRGHSPVCAEAWVLCTCPACPIPPLLLPLLPLFGSCRLWPCPRAGTQSPPHGAASAITSALRLLLPFPVLSRAVLAADLEGRQR